MGGLVAVAVGARLFSVAMDSYRSANPHLGSDFYHIPAPSVAESSQATLAAGLLAVGLAAVLVLSLMRVRVAASGWLLLRSVGAFCPIPIALLLAQPGLQGLEQPRSGIRADSGGSNVAECPIPAHFSCSYIAR
jgi:hypothetical protein